MPRTSFLKLIVLSLFATLACGPEPAPQSEGTATASAELRVRPMMRVMTHNVYVGANVDNVIAALATPDPNDDLVALMAAIQTFGATDVVARMDAIAREIDWTRPDVVGLQEVFIVDINIPGVATLYADFLQILQGQLAARGLAYDVAVQLDTTDAVLPGVRLQDRDVIMVKRGDVVVHETDRALFTDNEGDQGGGFPVVRGWTSILATVGGKTVQVLNTHMASGSDAATAALRELQAAELIALARDDIPVVLMGDLNGQPETASQLLLVGAGFADVWAALVPWSDGLTCCHADDLSNPEAAFDERIDYVMTKGFERGRRDVRGLILRLGLRPWEKVPGPAYDIWPSDHAGLWASLVLPR